MKTLLSIAVALLILAGLSACQNDENIGNRYGMWRLMAIDCNGVPEDFEGSIYWSFHTKVIEMKQFDASMDNTWNSWGHCIVNGDKMVLEFTYHDNNNPQGSEKYSPVPATHLPANAASTLEILHLSKSSMSLRYTAADGKIYTYNLKKWG